MRKREACHDEAVSPRPYGYSWIGDKVPPPLASGPVLTPVLTPGMPAHGMSQRFSGQAGLPPGTRGDVQTHPGFSQLGRAGCSWHRDQGCCSTSHNAQGGPHQKNDQVAPGSMVLPLRNCSSSFVFTNLRSPKILCVSKNPREPEPLAAGWRNRRDGYKSICHGRCSTEGRAVWGSAHVTPSSQLGLTPLYPSRLGLGPATSSEDTCSRQPPPRRQRIIWYKRQQCQGGEALASSDPLGSCFREALALTAGGGWPPAPSRQPRTCRLPGTCTWHCSPTSGSALSPACPCSAAAAAPARRRNTALSETGCGRSGHVPAAGQQSVSGRGRGAMGQGPVGFRTQAGSGSTGGPQLVGTVPSMAAVATRRIHISWLQTFFLD